MFIQGFEKVAVILPALQATRALATKGTRAVSKGVKAFASSEKSKGIAAYRKVVQPSSIAGGPRRAPGETLAKARTARAESKGDLVDANAVLRKAKGDVKERAKSMKESKTEAKPSFARKHPFITAGALYLGTKAAIGGGDDKQPSQQPQYVGPQY